MPETGIESLAVVLLTGLMAGWLAGIVTRGSGFGPLGNTFVALAGAMVGLYAGGWIGLGAAGEVFGKAVAAMLGAFGLLAIVAQFRR